ncbi:hypothetical protein EVA_12392 [gut metagenome]|uniref:Uncharacterized protein n=1 Tax=gut metagenome TaxID=749906 RepID=J9CHE4_9ZZZZ
MHPPFLEIPGFVQVHLPGLSYRINVSFPLWLLPRQAKPKFPDLLPCHHFLLLGHG